MRKNRGLQQVFRNNPSRYSQARYLGDGPRKLGKLLAWGAGIAFFGFFAVIAKQHFSTLVEGASNIRFIETANAKSSGFSGDDQVLNIEYTFDSPDIDIVGLDQHQAPSSSAPSTTAASPSTTETSSLKVVEAAGTAELPATTSDIAPVASTAPPELISVEFKSGDSFFDVAKAHGLTGGEILTLLRNRDAKRTLGHIRVGQTVHFHYDSEGEVESMRYQSSLEKELLVSRTEDGEFVAEVKMTPLRRDLRVAHGKIDSSLFNTAESIGISHNLVMNLADIYKWDIDFAKDIQANDEFALIYESFSTQEGTPVRTGKILAASFTNAGETTRAFLFEDDATSGYYTETGKSLRKSFLRNPVDIVRITSPFSTRRKHPILHKIKAHKGVDYGAKSGTPIHATADGIVEYRGTKGGYGRTVVLRHANGYSTLYAHMSKYSSKRKGDRIKQGQIVGYVGSSGWATGPHLHYEVRINGVHVDPLKLKTFGGSKLKKQQLAALKRRIEPLMTQLAEAEKQGDVSIASR